MRRSVPLVALLALLPASELAAQTLGTPIFMSPYRDFSRNELAAYISDPGEGVSFALEGEYRLVAQRFDVGLRGGFFDLTRNLGTRFGFGADGRILVSRHSEQFPLDVSLTIGAAYLNGDGPGVFLLPFGATLGRRVLLEGSSVSFTPFVHPVLAPTFSNDNSEVDFGFGLGVNISLSKLWDLRVSGALGDYEGVGVGLAWHR